MKVKLLNIVLYIFVIFVVSAFSDNVKKYAAKSGFQLSENHAGIMSVAMGYSGGAFSNSGCYYLNPALITLNETSFLYGEYQGYPATDLNSGYMEFGIPIKNFVLGVAFNTSKVKDIGIVDDFGNLKGFSGSQHFSFASLLGGYKLFDNLGIGLTIAGYQDRIFDSYAYAFVFGGGILYINSDFVNIGLSFTNLGITTPYDGKDKGGFGNGENLPFYSRLAFARHFYINDFRFGTNLDIVYRGVRNKEYSFKHRISERFYYPFGTEISFKDIVALRIGKRFNFQTELVNFGTSLHFLPFTIDAAFVIPRLEDSAEFKWGVSVKYSILKKINGKEILVKPQSK